MSRRYEWIVVLFAAVIFLSGIISPPSLMDDVDASQALIARNMLQSRDWVTARLDGVAFLDKAPLKYWFTAIFYSVFGVRDWVARIPGALSAIALCWVTFRFGRWAFSPKVGFYAGLFLSTCIGLFLFTRIVIPDVILTLSVTVSLWAFLRALDEQEENPRVWAYVMAASLAAGLLLKSLIGLVFPVGIAFVFLVFARRLFDRQTWKRLYPFTGFLIFVAIAAPWHVLATIRNPPYFDFTMHAGPGEYHGFFWFYFINEQVLRFLNARYPRDYNTVPRLYFWLFHLVWLFPWSVYLPTLWRLDYKPADRQGRARLLALCWIGLVMLFFTLSTTQEYYSMPLYPALALLLGSAMITESVWTRVGTRILGFAFAACAIVVAGLLLYVRHTPAPGDISRALQQHPEAYTLSLGHMGDLTLQSFAYLKMPLFLAGIAFLGAAIAAWTIRSRRFYLTLALAMVLFFHAARKALVVFDPYLSSRPLAEALLRSPDGQLILTGQYYAFSSVFFYTNRSALLW